MQYCTLSIINYYWMLSLRDIFWVCFWKVARLPQDLIGNGCEFSNARAAWAKAQSLSVVLPSVIPSEFLVQVVDNDFFS